MKCPHCDYKDLERLQDSDNPKRYTYPRGELGGFYELPVRLERDTGYWQKEQVCLYACPACVKTFVE